MKWGAGQMGQRGLQGVEIAIPRQRGVLFKGNANNFLRFDKSD